MSNSLGLRLGRNRGSLNSSPDLRQVETEDIRIAVLIFPSRNRGYLNSNPDPRSGRNRAYLNSSPEECQVGIEDI